MHPGPDPFTSMAGKHHPPHWRLPSLTGRQREQIRKEYAEAIQQEPDLSKSEFARRAALIYLVSAATIRRVLNNS